MKRSSIITTVAAALATAFPTIAVVQNDFSTAAMKTMEEALRGEGSKPTGICIAIPPLLGSRRTDQSAARAPERAAFVVQLRVNRNVQVTAAPSFNPYDAHDAIIDAVLGAEPLQIKAGDEDGNLTFLLLKEETVLTHGIHFTVQLNR